MMARKLVASGLRASVSGLPLSTRRGLATIASKQPQSEQSDFMANFIRQNKPPQSTIDHFSSSAWTRRIIENEAYETVPFYSRYFSEETGENEFFGRTVKTAKTVPRLLSRSMKNLQTPDSGPRPTTEEATMKTLTTSPDLLCLLSLDRGLASHPKIVHGGFQCVIFDEVIRLLILLHNNNICTAGPRDTHFTVSMTTSYAGPVAAPSDILVRSWLTGREGRKWWANAEIVNDKGQVTTKAEAMWVTAKNTIH